MSHTSIYRCAPGYYGNPNEEGSTCQPCQCSGNIDLNDRYACDIETGECLNCVNNTAGSTCNICRDWWYGDAVVDKNCQGMFWNHDSSFYISVFVCNQFFLFIIIAWCKVKYFHEYFIPHVKQ